MADGSRREGEQMKTYADVAKRANLEGGTKERFLRYMKTRWADHETTQCETGYALEWAGRFAAHCEYACSDTEGRQVLADMVEN